MIFIYFGPGFSLLSHSVIVWLEIGALSGFVSPHQYKLLYALSYLFRLNMGVARRCMGRVMPHSSDAEVSQSHRHIRSHFKHCSEQLENDDSINLRYSSE